MSITTTQYTEAADWLADRARPLLVSHSRPDGDALGALFALQMALATHDIHGTVLLFDEIPDRYALFRRHAPAPRLGHDLHAADLARFDSLVVLDTCTYSQLEPIADWLKESRPPTLAIDHHVTRNDLADRYLIDENAAATCLIVYEWLHAAGWSTPPAARDALFVGLATDTGWFRFPNTDTRALHVAAELTGAGVRPNDLYQALYQSESAARVRLLGVALSAMELHAGNQLAVMPLSLEMMNSVGATAADTEDIVNEPLRIGSVRVSVMLIEQEDGPIRVNFRSKEAPAVRSASDKPPDDPTVRSASPDANREAENSEHRPPPHELEQSPNPELESIDVAAIARVFGGGGHPRAAGARIPGALDEVRRRIIAALTPLL